MADHGEVSPDAFDDLDDWVASTLPRAVAYASSLLRDRILADDVVHDCYCRLLRKAGEYDLLLDGSKLLFRSITNACLNHNRRDRPHLSLDDRGPDGSRAPGVEDRRMIEPIQPLLDRELESAIAEGLARLPMAQRAALELKSLGHTLREIAEVLGTTPGNASVLIHRARQLMVGQLACYLEEPSQ
ncbi:RNA polymerase sigma factor [Tundrisphaera lichenicola]|uniref:RNA polymerase sigma factor n=1 Tax=Tundrisphaera lichenicola TaxID=2029860 RepID=UPI003EC0998B